MKKIYPVFAVFFIALAAMYFLLSKPKAAPKNIAIVDSDEDEQSSVDKNVKPSTVLRIKRSTESRPKTFILPQKDEESNDRLVESLDPISQQEMPPENDPRPFPSDLPKDHIYLYEKSTPVEVQQRFEAEILEIPAVKNLANVSEIECKEDSCEIKLKQDPKDRAAIQSAMMEFLASHQGDYGSYLSFGSVEGDPTAAIYTFNKDSQ